jgi:hypothetical protein
MNGLPGMFGSGMSETYETVRLFEFLQNSFSRVAQSSSGSSSSRKQCSLELPMEVSELYQTLLTLSRGYNSKAATLCHQKNSRKECQSLNYQFWNASNSHREEYLQRVSYSGYFTGVKATHQCSQLAEDIPIFLEKLRDGIQRSIQTQQGKELMAGGGGGVVPPTYFYYTVTSIQYLSPSTFTSDSPSDNSTKTPMLYLPAEFSQHSLPLFLEGATRMFKITSEISEKRQLYQAVS